MINVLIIDDEIEIVELLDFTVLLPTFRYIGMLGDIGGSRQEDIINDYVIAFFNKYLKGTNDRLSMMDLINIVK